MRALIGTVCMAAVSLPLWGGGLTFREPEKDLDVPPDERTVSVEFEFENKSDETVKIASTETTCSCLSVEVKDSKLSYAPGESGVIRGTFDMGNYSGEVEKVLHVWLEGDPEDHPSVNLTVRVHIPVLVDVEPKTLRWDLGTPAGAKTLKVTMNHGEPIHVTEVSCSNDNFRTELRELESGKSYEVVVTPKTTDEQNLGVITIATDCPLERHATQRAFSLVRRATGGPAEP